MPERPLPPAELEVLTCLHRRREATAREIREDLHAERPMAHGSVLTLLGRLENRGLVSRHKGPSGKAFVYVPTGGRRATIRPLLSRLVKRVFAGSSADLVASLFETRPPTANELKAIERLVRDLKKKRKAAS